MSLKAETTPTERTHFAVNHRTMAAEVLVQASPHGAALQMQVRDEVGAGATHVRATGQLV